MKMIQKQRMIQRSESEPRSAQTNPKSLISKPWKIWNILFILFLITLIGLRIGIRGLGSNSQLTSPSVSQTKQTKPIKENWVNFPNINDINDILPDGNILWLGTSGGLAKVDQDSGSVVAIFTMAEGLASNSVTDIERQGDYLWIAVQGGISRLDTSSNVWKHYTVENGLVNGSNIELILFNDELWIGTFGGAGKYDQAHDSWINYFQGSGSTSLYASKDELWACINCGNYQYTNRVGYFDPKISNWVMKDKDVKGSDTGDTTYTRITANDERIWVQTGEVSSKFDKKTDFSFKRNYLTSKIESLTGEKVYDTSWHFQSFIDPYLLISTNNNNFLLYDPQNDALEVIKLMFTETQEGEKCDLSLFSPAYNFRISGDLIWFLNEDNVCNLNLRTKQIRSFPIKNSLPQIGQILSSLGDKLLLARSGEIIVFNPGTNEGEILTGLYRKISIYAISPEISFDPEQEKLFLLNIPESSEGQTEVTTLWIYDMKTKSLQKIPLPNTLGASTITYREGSRLAESTAQDELFLVSTNDLLVSYDTVRKKWGAVDFNTKVYDVKITQNQDIWLATDKGIGKLVNDKLELLSVQPAERENDPTGQYRLGSYTLEVDTNSVWAYRCHQLHVYDRKTKTFTNITSSIPSGPGEYAPDHDNWKGNPSVEKYGCIRSVKYVDGTLWVGTSSGLAEFDFQTKKWQLHNAANGMMGNDIYRLFFVEGKPWVVTDGGLTRLE